MRIDGPYRPTAGNRSGKTSAASSSGFKLDTAATPGRPAAVANAAPATALDALLALQSVDDPLLRRKKAVRRGKALVDALDGVMTDLLAGRMAEGRLNQLMAAVSQVRESSDPELDALIDDIELRARVELAKYGRFPS